MCRLARHARVRSRMSAHVQAGALAGTRTCAGTRTHAHTGAHAYAHAHALLRPCPLAPVGALALAYAHTPAPAGVA